MAAPTDKRASELTAPVSIEDADTFPGYRPGTGGEPNLDIRASAGLIRAPIIASLAAGTVPVGSATDTDSSNKVGVGPPGHQVFANWKGLESERSALQSRDNNTVYYVIG